jgi:predicted ATP-grasp superfamily ATP-dependent carboligase
MSARILVLDGQTTQALACARSLGRAGYPVFVASTSRRPLAAWSRHVRAAFRLDDETTASYAGLRTWARAHEITVVLPVTERSCRLCNADRDRWESAGMILGCGPDDMLLHAFDKAATLRSAVDASVRIPPTRFPTSFGECADAAREIGFPCVVKSRFSNPWNGSTFGAGPGTTYAESVTELLSAVRAHTRGGYWPLIQGYVPGRGKAVAAVFDDGRPISWFAYERLRDVRPSGSGSSLRRSIALDPRLREPAERLLARWKWRGPAMVEFRDDGTDPCLMEVNGRFWGSLELAVLAGADFPRVWVCLLTGASLASTSAYTEGVTVRWLLGDLKYLLHALIGPPAGYRGPFPTRLDALKAVCGPQPRGTRLETWNRADRWPALGEWVQALTDLLGGRTPPARVQSGRPRASDARDPLSAPGLSAQVPR